MILCLKNDAGGNLVVVTFVFLLYITVMWMDYMYAIFIFLIVHRFWADHADLLLKCGVRSDPRCADQVAGLVYVSFTAFWKGKKSIIRQKYLNY
jgi:hypothetical protein